MFKKNIILVLALLSFLPFVFSATEVINSCPGTSINNNTEYILSDNFVINQNPCFDFQTGYSYDNITINGNGTEIEFNSGAFVDGNQVNKIDELYIKNINTINEGSIGGIFMNFPMTDAQGDINLVDIYNSSFEKISSLIAVDELNISEINLEKIYIESDRVFYPTTDYTVGFTVGNFHIEDLDFKAYNTQSSFIKPTGSSSIFRVGGSFMMKNVNLGTKYYWDEYYFAGDRTISTYIYGTYTYDNVLDGSLTAGSDVLLPFGESDENIVRESTNGVVYSSAKEPTMQECQSGLCPHDNMAWISQAWQSPSAYDSNTWYLQTQLLTLNATFYHNFLHTVGVTLDLSSMSGASALELKNTRTLRFDTSSTLYGGDDTSSKPRIFTSGTGLETSYTGGIYNTNYQLIEFQNDLTIDNINFDMDVAQDYGIVRPTDAGDDGLFQMYDSIVDINHNIDEEDMPQFVVGAMMDLQDNVFEIGQQYNITMFAGGISAGAGGGHKVINNEFQGGGFIFNHLQDGVILNLPSKFIHNEFTQDGAFYGLPFDTQFGDYALLEDPSLNGTMIYETACTNYLFNIGNYYEDLDDVYTFNDTDLDGIADEEYYRGRDINGDNITDPRVIINYPYTFTNYLGKAYDTFDTCGDFAFDVEEPKDEIIYNETHDVISKWSYESTVYSDLICIESLNGHANIINNVDSDEVIVTDWDTSNGAFNYDLKCCDTVSCDNFVKAIDTIFFCVDNCNVPGEILDITTPAVYGCTDPEASNYDPTATIDDGSCEYDEPDEDDGGGSVDTGSVSGSINTDNLFSGDLDLTLDSLLNMFKLLNTPIIFLIFIGFIIVIIALFILIWSLFGLLMPGGK